MLVGEPNYPVVAQASCLPASKLNLSAVFCPVAIDDRCPRRPWRSSLCDIFQ